MGNFLRAEARPIIWKEQYRTQQEALEQLVRMLNEAVDDIRANSKSSANASNWLDEQRSSRVAFLVGDRGTGKTSVMATLFKACDPNLDSQKTTDLAGDSAAAVIQQIRNRLVWLEPLDAETVTESTNLLAAILARVELACEQRNPCYGSQSPHAGLLSPDQQEPMQMLQRLQTKIAVAWDNNVRDRRANLDPTNMANEWLQTERAKLSLNERLNGVLDKLAASYHANCVNDPLFVLPVDDFDLNPSACVQLLKIIRLVSAKRLFFLVLGDIEVAEVVMNLHQSAELGGITKNVRNSVHISAEAEAVVQVAAETAGNALRKLVPPAQRVQLLKPTIVEALNFQPLGSTESEERLHKLLDKFPTFALGNNAAGKQALPTRPMTIRELLLKPCSLLLAADKTPRAISNSSQLEEGDLANCCYSALELFRTTLRRLADIWYDCFKLATTYTEREKKASRLGVPTSNRLDSYQADVRRFLYIACKDLLNSEAGLTPLERGQVVDALERIPRRDWYFGQLPLELVAQTEPVAPLEPKDGSNTRDVSHEFQFRRVTGWGFAMANRGESKVGSVNWMRPETAGMLTLFHDITVMLKGNRQAGGFVLDNAALTADWAGTVWKRGLIEVQLPWPAPPCASVWELDRFVFAWNDFLARAPLDSLPPDESASAAAFAWISAGTATVDGTEPVTWSGSPKEIPWKLLQGRLEALANRVDRVSFHGWRYRRWLCSIAAFLTPELGQPIVGLDWSNCPDVWKVWKRERAYIIWQRALLLAKLHRRRLLNLVESFLPMVLTTGNVSTPIATNDSGDTRNSRISFNVNLETVVQLAANEQELPDIGRDPDAQLLEDEERQLVRSVRYGITLAKIPLTLEEKKLLRLVEKMPHRTPVEARRAFYLRLQEQFIQLKPASKALSSLRTLLNAELGEEQAAQSEASNERRTDSST